MTIADLVTQLRDEANPGAWTAAVQLARDGAVSGLGTDDGALVLGVRTRARATSYQVHIWLDQLDTGCECDLDAPCVHVCAAAIAVGQGLKVGQPLPQVAAQYRVKLRYDLKSDGPRLSVQRVILWPDGREQVLKGALAETNVLATPGDAQAERILLLAPPGALDEDKMRRLLSLLPKESVLTLDGKTVRLDHDPVWFVVRVIDEEERFRIGIYRPAGLDRLFLGAALIGNVLRPTTAGELPETERRALHPGRSERVFSKDQVGWIVSEYLPRLRGFGLPVEVETTRLPASEALEPRVRVELSTTSDGLLVRPVLVYGDPPVARVEDGRFVRLGDVVPARDPAAERRAARAFEESTRLLVGIQKKLNPADAAAFLDDLRPRLGVEVVGKVDRSRFRVVNGVVVPTLEVLRVDTPDGEGAHTLSVAFAGPDGANADPAEVLRAWRGGRSLVPLVDGGWAPLPVDWLATHGALLEELLAARDSEGRVARAATAALVELLEGTAAQAPPDLARLRAWLDDERGLPEIDPPEGLKAEFRPYQLAGYRWLSFLRDTGLHGVLADDMGLGKTVQAIAVLLATPGPHLVVAPTSVLRNWERELNRFAPSLTVCTYHGPNRRLDKTADVVVTSYALLRLDLDRLRGVPWTYAILDEAQAIKNSDSQTARSAFALPAKHRLALTGTPVENRLEELWSLFRFLQPGLLGPQSSFRERFVHPIEGGDREAGKRLRRRVRPYILRRMKGQVATDLPPLTDIIVRCELSPEQRRVYEAVRDAARADVWQALADRGHAGFQMQILEALLRMRQACVDPSLLPGNSGQGAPSAKLDELESMLVELVVDDHKVLVFSQWTSVLDRIEPRLVALGIPWVRLDGTTRDRQAVIDKFQEPGGPSVFLLSLKAGGTGLNLTAADYVVHLDPWWNPAVQQQATDRAWRIGQDRPVVSCRYIAEGTVEERILELQEAKKALAEAALGEEGGFVKALSGDELRALFDAA